MLMTNEPGLLNPILKFTEPNTEFDCPRDIRTPSLSPLNGGRIKGHPPYLLFNVISINLVFQ